MTKKHHPLSDLTNHGSKPSIDGSFSLDGQFTLTHRHASTAGNFYRNQFELESDYGSGDFLMLGTQHYTAVSESYDFKKGTICSIYLDQPFMGLFFQLSGSTRTFHAGRSSMNITPDLLSGEANLIMMPAFNDSFELKEELSGSTFAVLFSNSYLQDLSSRFPHLLEPVFDKAKKQGFYMHLERNLKISPRMQVTIQDIRRQEAMHSASPLFLESRILDLLAMFFTQSETPLVHRKTSLPPSDRDRIYMARDYLIERLTDPPTLAELARHVGTNEYKLKRTFKEIFSLSPYAYHLQHKLELAKSYILDTDLTIAEIAYSIGYSDPAHFTHAFRKQYNIRPSDLR